MKTKFYFLLFLTSLAFGEIASYGQGYILYVRTNDSDQGFVDMLTTAGYDVLAETGTYEGILDAEKLDVANNAALIILSRNAATSEHAGSPELASQWNEMEPPLICFSAWLARSNRLMWVNTDQVACEVGQWRVAPGEESNDAFEGVTIGGGGSFYIFDPVSGDGMGIADAGYGTALATSDTNATEALVMARWEALDNFYEGTEQFAGNTRVFFGVGASDCGNTPNESRNNYYNLNEAGLTILLNLISEFIPLESDIEENTLKTNSLSLFPNPARSILRVDYKSDYAGEAVLSMADMTGKVVHRETINLIQGANNRYVNVSRLTKGVYMLSLDYEDNQVVTKVMVK